MMGDGTAVEVASRDSAQPRPQTTGRSAKEKRQLIEARKNSFPRDDLSPEMRPTKETPTAGGMATD